MRLSVHQHGTIKRCFKEVFSAGDMYLFGSRVEDSKKVET